MNNTETAAATIAAKARVRAAVHGDPLIVQLNAFLTAYLDLVSVHGLRHEAGEQLMQIGAAIVWADANEPQSFSSLIH